VQEEKVEWSKFAIKTHLFQKTNNLSNGKGIKNLFECQRIINYNAADVPERLLNDYQVNIYKTAFDQ
jgi:hypothetical protein